MHLKNKFFLILALSLGIYGLYGVKRATLGVDFTDEGVYVSHPLRLLFGETLFSSEITTLTKPYELILFLVLKLRPSATLFELRLYGWALHLTAFALLSAALFMISRAPFLSVGSASIPLFISNSVGLITPSYNTISSDMLVCFLGLRVISIYSHSRWRFFTSIMAGFALFIAVLCYPPLLLVAAFSLAAGITLFLLKDKISTPDPIFGVGSTLGFAAGSIIFITYLAASGAATHWFQRVPMAFGFALTSIRINPVRFYAALFDTLAWHNNLHRLYSIVAILAPLVLWFRRVARQNDQWHWISHLFALFSLLSLFLQFFFDYYYLPTFFYLVSIGMALVYLSVPSNDRTANGCLIRQCLWASILASVIYATSTYYFNPYHSLKIGSFGLPFCFGLSMTRLVSISNFKFRFHKVCLTVILGALLVSLGIFHYHCISRDAPPSRLTATFSIPKLRYIKSTDERVQGIETLYRYMKPRIIYGEPLVVYDDCPLIYYLLDAKPAYGLTWARQTDISVETLDRLDQELKTRPLPRYAIREMVDVSQSGWRTLPRVHYDHYPLNMTIMANYELEKSLFPFEVWRLKANPSQ